MTPFDRLMAEAIPVRPPKPPVPPWTPEDQARHLADLLEALGGWQSDEPSAVRRPQTRTAPADTDRPALGTGLNQSRTRGLHPGQRNASPSPHLTCTKGTL